MKRLLLVLLASILGVVALAPAPAHASPGWEIVLDRPTPNFGGIDFVSADEGWMTAGAGLLHTTDGGATWTEAAQLSGVDVDFADAGHGWLVGYNGSIWATANGQTWQEQDSGTHVHLFDVIAVSPSEAWVLGLYEGFSDVGPIYPPTSAFLHTTDGGVTWVQVAIPPQSWFNSFTFVGEQGWALGETCSIPPPDQPAYICPDTTPSLLHTTDAGATWSLLDSDVPLFGQHLVFVSSTHGWATGTVCPSGLSCTSGIAYTTDGGHTWHAVDVSALGQPTSLAFEDELNGLALARDCTPTYDCSLKLLTTTDGGVSWQSGPVFSNATGHSERLVIANETLYVTSQNAQIGGGLTLRSTDGGATWEEMDHPATVIGSPDFVDRRLGFTNSGGRLLRTDDAGRSWNRVAELPDGTGAIDFVDDQVGFAIAGNCCIGTPVLTAHRTDNGGLSWQQVYQTTALGFNYMPAFEFSDAQHGLVALQYGTLMTSDGGETWQERALPTGQYLVDADLAVADEAWMVTTGQYDEPPFELVHTTDGGATWTQAPTTLSGSIQRIVFVDALHGFYLGGTCNVTCTDTLYGTDDGGETWQARGTRERNAYAPDFTFVDRLNGWLDETSCGESGCSYHISHTTDGGRTWTSQLSGNLLVGVFEFVDAENGWFLLDPYRTFGVGGGPPQRTVLYHTSDGGGGPVGIVPTPTMQLPDVGARVAGSSGPWPIAIALAALGASLAIAGAMALRR